MIERTLHRRNVFLFILVTIVVLSIIFSALSLIIIHPPKPEEDNYFGRDNILFIIIDDLRPALRCYGDSVAVTPNMDALASNSIIFKNAYAQQALGAPSRISFLVSHRPDSLHLYDDTSNWRAIINDFRTLPEHFKNHGYETISVGKVFPRDNLSEITDHSNSWSFDPYWPSSQEYETKPVCPSYYQMERNLLCAVDVENQPERTLPDIQITDYAIEFLKYKSSRTAPFFLAVGYQKPHIPFRIPRGYFDLYPDMNLAANHTQSHFPKVAWNPWVDIREMDDIKSLNLSSLYDILPEDMQKLIRQGYYASVSYIDDQLGRLLQALEDTGYAEHTTIVLFGDHGWSLGEHQEWSKYSNFEVAVQVPLIVHVPDLTTGKKRKPFHRTSVLDLIPTNVTYTAGHFNVAYNMKNPAYISTHFIELVDIFPTLSQISSIAVPPFCDLNVTEFCSEGISFYPVIEHMVYDPEPWIPFSWKTAAFSQYPRPSLAPIYNSDKPSLEDIQIMGYSIRTDKYRYTEWVAFDNINLKPDWALIISRELYSHEIDPSETKNLCDEEAFANTVISLSRRLKNGWREEMPPGCD